MAAAAAMFVGLIAGPAGAAKSSAKSIEIVSDIARDSMRVEARGESWLLTLRADLALSERGEQ